MKALKLSFISIIIMLTVVLPVIPLGTASADEGAFSDDQVFYVEKESGDDFVILQLTDLHISSALQGERDVFPYMRRWVNQVQPDLIVITGDGVNGTSDDSDMKALIAEMNSYETPWTYVFGNHEKDASGGVRRLSALLADEASKNPLLLYSEGVFTDEGRYGNYVVNIMQKNKLIYSLFFLDSGREYDTFLPSQTEWYAEAVKSLSKEFCGDFAPFEGKVIPSMIFHHIPTDEYQYAANSVLTRKYNDGTYEYEHVRVGTVPRDLGLGTNNEFAYGQRDDIAKNGRIHSAAEDKALVEYSMYTDARSEAGFVSMVKDLHSTTHMFCGHRHSNDSTIFYEGITYTFGTKTGKGNSTNAKQMGSTTITIENRTNTVEIKHNYD